MTESRPWWASEGPIDGGVDPDEDPVETHRAARRGPRGEVPGARADERDAPDGERSGGAERSGAADPGAEVCGVCPICVAGRMLTETRPDLVRHLVAAGRHLTAAMRAVLEPDEGSGPPPASRHRGPR